MVKYRASAAVIHLLYSCDFLLEISAMLYRIVSYCHLCFDESGPGVLWILRCCKNEPGHDLYPDG